jgi:conjugative relaxase-like TrwC/TraI family protein
MLTISRPLSAGQARRYHAEEFQNARENYYAEGERIIGVWHGKLAAEWGLSGEVREEYFHRLSEGQHPITGEALVRHQTARTSANARGDTVTTMEHRAGWDATFSAPKTVSLTALVGDDARVREAHEASVEVALDELERYVQARLGGNRPAETTGNWVAAKFEHDSARPVDGYAAPQLHTHVIVFNLTHTDEGDIRPLQPRELYKTQQFATAVYRSELAARLSDLGYEIERGKSGQPEIAGYSHDYVDASSPRRRQIEEHLAQAHRTGAGAAQIAAHQTREAKLDLTHDEMQQRHQTVAEAFGNQPELVVQAAREHAHGLESDHAQITAHAAVTFGKERNLEREAVVDERVVLRDALNRSMGDRTIGEIKGEFETRVGQGEFIQVAQAPGAPGRAFTTRETIELERETIQMMRAGQHQHEALGSDRTRRDVDREHGELSEGQRAAVRYILESRDQVIALEGVAGAGKTTTLSVVRTAAEREGYAVEGFAPTSRAAQKLGEAGIKSSTLQRHLARSDESNDGQRRLYVLDEASLASTKQVHAFFERLESYDRVLLVGDVRQHQAVDAGRPYQQLQESGVHTVRLDEIVRQKDPELKTVVAQLSRGEVSDAVKHLEAQGRVHEIPDRAERFQEIAREYARSPDGTLVVSPDNQSRIELNAVIHRTMQEGGHVNQEEHAVRVLVPRQDLTGPDRQWAARYEPGDVVRYTRGSETLGLDAGEYVRVLTVNTPQNLLTVQRETGEQVTYDPRRLQGVMLYRETERAFAVGDRVQVTAPYREDRVANRELGTLEKIDAGGHLNVSLDSGRSIAFEVDAHRHLDHGYAVTSHSSQGQTADRVLLQVDTARTGEALVNQRLAYVAVSRGRYDAQIYTNDKSHLAESLGRKVSHRSAMEPSQVLEGAAKKIEPSRSQSQASRQTGLSR